MKVHFMEPAPELGDGSMQGVHFLDIEEAWEYLEEHGPQRPLEYLEPEVTSSKVLVDAWSTVATFIDRNPGITHARSADFRGVAGMEGFLDDWEHPAEPQVRRSSRAAPSALQIDTTSGITLEEAEKKLAAAQKKLIDKVAAMNALRRAAAAWDEDGYESSTFPPLPAWYSKSMKSVERQSPL